MVTVESFQAVNVAGPNMLAWLAPRARSGVTEGGGLERGVGNRGGAVGLSGGGARLDEFFLVHFSSAALLAADGRSRMG